MIVGVSVGIGVFVTVGVEVAVGVGVAVGVSVGVGVGVLVGVFVWVGVFVKYTLTSGGRPKTRATRKCSKIPDRSACNRTLGQLLLR